MLLPTYMDIKEGLFFLSMHTASSSWLYDGLIVALSTLSALDEIKDSEVVGINLCAKEETQKARAIKYPGN
ncbi:hypothetical protein PtrSN002B_006049 [Pyrenophora tritici-repentis]|uniref:Uncharacterized protein n=1 Tax=Pyrenophora tritici-repentis TaxID=45151 RepID=A0A2W1E182_9PLEO|nr:hypothetical protein PtrV1_13712 [Pyrenophora tritici-repentis]KAF7447257.1 hypothetical protein A1F99_087040 [Pyrenophora tritici-repentis]KAF7569617.1 hypothetical protein PtrM4_120320 [Pyrenophora tritici-repentis]KAI0572384.1 hypothetical protein Alg215_09825 [Pyrenophora tritici-repentis]KAI0579898.1 hypothetical protein Alg130_07297 [Pyrenophora tritici-repentis]